MTYCTLCPNDCRVDRQTSIGRCSVGSDVRIAKYYLHPFEEPVVSGKNGSGTVFFCGCSLKCKFCQNFEVSRNLTGKNITPACLADIFKQLEDMGAENINLVTPTQFVDGIIRSLDIYRPKIPVCYNTHGYEKIQTLNRLNDYVDVYMPDLKYYSPARSKRYSGVENYFEFALPAIEFMINSKPKIESGGMLKQGVIVRHLVLPQNVDQTRIILEKLRPIIKDAYLSLMAQYTPITKSEFPELNRKITVREYRTAVDAVNALKYENVFIQEFSSQDKLYIPKWDY